MKQNVYFSTFRDAFEKLRPYNFSYGGLEILFEYLEECQKDTGEEYELDVIALCCDFAEDSWQSIAENYSVEYDENEYDGEGYEKVKEYLIDEGVFVGEVSGGFVYRQH